MGNKKKLPVGVDSFSKLVQQGFYYIDKTGLLIELLDNWAKVNLFTRPRRFGKSMNMPKSRDIRSKIPLPQAIWNEFWLRYCEQSEQ